MAPGQKSVPLKEWADATVELFEESKKRNEFLPQQETYVQWKLNSFKYDQKGPRIGGATDEFFTKKSWKA